VPLKGARDFSEGRLVPLMMRSAQALTDYLRVRRSHRQARLPALWLGSRNRGPMTGSGVYQMLDRRAEEAGYDPQAVHPHILISVVQARANTMACILPVGHRNAPSSFSPPRSCHGRPAR
jgi:site-specific recombinase XerC